MMLVLLLLFSSALTASGQDTNTTVAPTMENVASPPTSMPTFPPATASPSFLPTRAPQTSSPTAAPTADPTAAPSVSARPTVTKAPTANPSSPPTASPSAAPSATPSSRPTFTENSTSAGNFRMTLLITVFRVLNSTEVDKFTSYMENSTQVFAPGAVGTETECRISGQTVVACSAIDTRCTNWGVNISNPNSTDGFLNDLDLFCGYSSKLADVTGYPDRFARYTEQNAGTITDDLQSINLPVIRSFAAGLVATPAPTAVPLASPTISPAPSTGEPTKLTNSPTDLITSMPTFVPTAQIMLTVDPTSVPTGPPPDGGNDEVKLIAGVVVSVGIVVLVGIFLFYRRRLKKRDAPYTTTPAEEPNKVARSKPSGNYQAPMFYGGDNDSEAGQALIAPSESLVSNKSLISAGSGFGGDGSDASADNTKGLQDEFDSYKNQSVEQFRSDVDNYMPGFEGIMSAAVTRALMEDDEPDSRIDETVTWGCEANASGPEIEASALSEVNEWLKRKGDGATIEQKRIFMQNILNRMVSSVRFGVVMAEDASRTIHESAALMGLELANELPMSTVIISGMRKTADASHMISVLKEFGDIDVAAVASKQKGFGIVRFRHPKSVDRVMRRYRSGEIVIQDVAVQIKALMPSGHVEGRNG